MNHRAEGNHPKPAQLQAPLARLLRPLVRLLIRCGMTYPMLMNLLRELYVNVAEYDFALSGKEQTDSRVSLLTGIHRKEVARLRGAGAPVSAVPAALSRTSLILARWLAAPEFLDESGKPRPLARLAGRSPSFDMLVESVTRDLRPRAILDEWLDRRLVRLDEEDRVVLLESALIPNSGDEQQLYYFGRNLHDHVAAAVANVMAASPTYFERAVHYDGLSSEVALELQRRSHAMAMDLLQTANKDAHQASESAKGGNWRWNLGIYVFAEEEREPIEQAPELKVSQQ